MPPAQPFRSSRTADFEAEQYISQSHNINPGPPLGPSRPAPQALERASTTATLRRRERHDGERLANGLPARGRHRRQRRYQHLADDERPDRRQNLHSEFFGQGDAGTGLGGATRSPFPSNSTLTIGGSTVLSPGTSSYTTYSTTFVATSSSMPLRFFDVGSPASIRSRGSTTSSWASPRRRRPTSSRTAASRRFLSAPTRTTPTLQAPAGRSRAGTGRAGTGIDRGNLYGCPNAPAYEGSQNAFLQGPAKEMG